MKLNKSEQELLQGISDLHQIEQGSFNIRKNGEAVERRSSADIEIVPKTKKPGIDIIIKPNVKNKSVHIPVIISKGGITDLVYNDFYVGENSEVLIVAGCGIHNTSDQESQHNGIHSFHIGKNSKVKYVEKHLGLGKETSGKILNPETKIVLEENAVLEMIFFGRKITLDFSENQLCIGKSKAPVSLTKENMDITLLIDRCGAEIFADRGKICVFSLATAAMMDRNLLSLVLTCNTEYTIDFAEIHALEPIWQTSPKKF